MSNLAALVCFHSFAEMTKHAQVFPGLLFSYLGGGGGAVVETFRVQFIFFFEKH